MATRALSTLGTLTRAFTPESGDDRGRSARAALLTAADQIGRDEARGLLGHLQP
jgi:hypothetical protein